MTAAWRRPVIAALAVVALLPGCTYSAEEPGLFSTPEPSRESSPPRRDPFRPKPTNPRLPVAGERVWVSGSQPTVTLRIAVHAVRRIERATVLDWSVTPIAAPGLEFGDPLPGTELGLTRPIEQNQPSLLLVDPAAQRAYYPLAHASREVYKHCLCTPLWVLAQSQRLGETRLLQIAYPELPASLAFVDITLGTVAPVRHVPVSPEGTVPTPVQATDLARAAPAVRPGGARLDFRNPSRSQQRQRIQVARVLAAPGGSALEWTLASLDDQQSRVLAYEPPITRPETAEIANGNAANGPVLRVGGARVSNLWSRTTVVNRTAYECLCTEIGLWTAGLRTAGGTVGLVTSFPALPAGTRTVDVEYAGFGTFRAVPVVAAEDAASRLRPPEPAATGRWAYAVDDPPRGWPTADWPTDTPDPAQLAEYEARVEPIRTLPPAT